MAAAEEEAAPSYPEMIMEAIDALNEKNGSNKSAISRYIESKLGEVPPTHAALLTEHLFRMRDSGELLFIKNNYFRPGPDAPPKRGRGRPPKSKTGLAPGAAASLSPPRPRGRPPKPKDPLDATVAKASAGLPRPRGRPPKVARPDGPVASAPAAAGDVVVKRGRGRPPKAKPAPEPAPAMMTDAV